MKLDSSFRIRLLEAEDNGKRELDAKISQVKKQQDLKQIGTSAQLCKGEEEHISRCYEEINSRKEAVAYYLECHDVLEAYRQCAAAAAAMQ